MCNLYRITTNQQAIRDFVAATHDSIGNLEPSMDVYPDRPAPVVRNTDGGRELASLTWGMPTPVEYLKSRDAPDTGVTNIRNTASPHWRKWLGLENRCVVPATAFSEYGQKPDPVTKRKPLHWFALDETQPLFFFAGIWTPWRGTRARAWPAPPPRPAPGGRDGAAAHGRADNAGVAPLDAALPADRVAGRRGPRPRSSRRRPAQ